MSTSTAARPKISGPVTGVAARLIPGALPTAGEIPRQRPQSVTLDGRFWVLPERQPRPADDGGTAPNFIHAVLPEPWIRAGGAELITKLLIDSLVIALSFEATGFLGALFASLLDSASILITLPALAPSSGILLLFVALFTLIGYSERIYRPGQGHDLKRERTILRKALAWTTLLLGGAVACGGMGAGVAPVLFAGVPLSYIGMLGWRKWHRAAISRNVETRRETRNVLILGAGRIGRNLAAHLARHPAAGRVVRGFLDDSAPIAGDVLGRLCALAGIARAEFIDEIIVTIPYQQESVRQAIREARRNRLDVKLAPDLLGIEAQPELFLERVAGVPILSLHRERLPEFGLLLKRVADVLLSSAGFVALFPLFATIAVLIKLDSPGPVLYCAPRVGRKGTRFSCYKFRTMVLDADARKEKLRQKNERAGPFFKIADDPRITRAGRLLRRYSLDELPQLWNVLRGEMSLVGPRPHPLDDYERYELEHLLRLDVTPGMTGLWQVTARSDPSFHRNLTLDVEYIERWSLSMDFHILAKTLSAVVRGSGA